MIYSSLSGIIGVRKFKRKYDKIQFFGSFYCLLSSVKNIKLIKWICEVRWFIFKQKCFNVPPNDWITQNWITMDNTCWGDVSDSRDECCGCGCRGSCQTSGELCIVFAVVQTRVRQSLLYSSFIMITSYQLRFIIFLKSACLEFQFFFDFCKFYS